MVFTVLPTWSVMTNTDDVVMNADHRTFDRWPEAIMVRTMLEADDRAASRARVEG